MEFNNVIKEKVKEDNYKVFALLSRYLNNTPTLLTKKKLKKS